MAYNNNKSNRGYDGVKRSGCKRGTDKNGKHFLRGWNYSSSKKSFVTVYASPWSKTAEHTSKKGKVYANWYCRCETKGGASWETTGWLNMDSGILTVPSMGWVLNPKANHGGYCGTYEKRKDK